MFGLQHAVGSAPAVAAVAVESGVSIWFERGSNSPERKSVQHVSVQVCPVALHSLSITYLFQRERTR